jgi:hypothetical protein
MTLRGQQAEGAHEVEIEIRASAARVLEVLSVPQTGRPRPMSPKPRGPVGRRSKARAAYVTRV